MPDTLAALADESLDRVLAYGGPHAFMQAVEDGEPGAVAFAAEIDERAARLGATDADLRKAIRAAGTRRGMLPTMH